MSARPGSGHSPPSELGREFALNRTAAVGQGNWHREERHDSVAPIISHR
jgi:hypothetical protein